MKLKPLFLLFLLSSCLVTAQEEGNNVSAMEEAEQGALYAVIRSLVGWWFNGTELYPDPCGWTPIQGVSCDLFGGLWYATTIAVGRGHDGALDCADDAALDRRLFQLKHLKSLSFSGCFRRPTAIPTANWAAIAGSLEVLEFRSNSGLVGAVPVSFGSIGKLQSLVLLENNLAGELPELGGLTELRQLVLAGNRFSGDIPASWGRLKKLLIMDLSRNSLSGPLLASLGRLASLIKLDLSNNSLEGVVPVELGQLKNLTLLDLRNNRFTNGLPQSLQDMVSLEEMLLANNPIAGELAGIDWKKLESLIILDLSSMGLVGDIPESMAGMKRLRFLALDNNHLSGIVPANLENMPSVNAVHLNGNNLAGQLQFSEGFYRKLGRHFVAWDNPNLCYDGEMVGGGNAPFGVTECTLRHDQIPSSKSGVKSLTSGGDCKLMGTCVFSSSGVSRAWCWAEMVAILFAYLMLWSC